MNKTIYALIAAMIIVVAVPSSYFLFNSRKLEGGGGNIVANAASLQYNAEVKNVGWTRQVYTVSAKNVNAPNMMLRVEFSADTGANVTWILNHGTDTAWLEMYGNWTDISRDFANQWKSFVGENSRWTTDVGHLVNDWSGTGDCNYVNSTTGETVTVYNVTVNPTLADSLFQYNP